MAAFLITGATGLIGQALCQRLLNNGETVFALSRNCQKAAKILGSQVQCFESVDSIPADHHIDVVINLAGAPIVDKRWTDARKQILLKSRVDYTRDLIDKLSKRSSLPHSFISGSAVGWYGNQHDTIVTEVLASNQSSVMNYANNGNKPLCLQNLLESESLSFARD